MNRSSSRVWLLLLSVLCCAIMAGNLLSESETGSDTFLYHAAAERIVDEGRVDWSSTPFSAFGLDSVSIPLGVPLVLSALRLLTGLEMSACIQLLSALEATIALLGSWILARSLSRHANFAVLFAIAFVFAPVFLFLTTFTAGPRGLFVALEPLILWLVITSKFPHRMPRTILLVTLALVELTIHRMAFLLFLMILAVPTLTVILSWADMKTSRFKTLNMPMLMALGITSGFFVVESIGLSFYATQAQSVRLNVGGFFPEALGLSVAGNLAVDFASKLGLPIVGILAFPWLISGAGSRRIAPPQLAAFIIICAPFLVFVVYATSAFLAPFLLFLVAGLVRVSRAWASPRARRQFLGAILGASVVFSLSINLYWQNQPGSGDVGSHMTTEVLEAGLYLRSEVQTPFVSTGLVTRQLTASSGFSYISPRWDPWMAILGAVDPPPAGSKWFLTTDFDPAERALFVIDPNYSGDADLELDSTYFNVFRGIVPREGNLAHAYVSVAGGNLRPASWSYVTFANHDLIIKSW